MFLPMKNPVAFVQAVLDEMIHVVVVLRLEADDAVRIVAANREAAQNVTGVSLVGAMIQDHFPPDEVVEGVARMRQCVATHEVIVHEAAHRMLGETFWRRTIYRAFFLPEDPAPYILMLSEDITAQKQQEARDREQQEAIITQQQATLAELSTPLLAISDTTMVMPIIGTVDSRRVQQIMSTLLSGVAARHAHTVILDITGVPVVDTQVANALMRAAQAVRLLGAQIVLTGIRPEVAQTLVGLGVELAGIITRSSLQSGIAEALARERRAARAASDDAAHPPPLTIA